MKLSELARVYDRVSAAGSDAKRIGLLAELFRATRGRTLAAVAHLTAGELVAPQLADKLGVGPGAIRDALARASNLAPEEIEREARRTGDLGEVVAASVAGADTLTVDELWRRANRAVERGEERGALVEHVFKQADAAGAKYFTRMALNQMRIGVGTNALVRAIAAAFNVEPAAVERLYAISNDIGFAAAEARRGPRALGRAGLALFRPYQFMNAHKVDDPARVFETLAGKRVIFEVKYDGARLQMHVRKATARAKPEIKLYSRRLNDDTAAMPDVVAALAEAWRGGDAIIEGEAVAFDPALKKRLPFQSVLQRLGRVHNVAETAREIPLVLFLFDLLYDRGEDLMNVAQAERRLRLEKLFRPTARVQMTESVVSDRRADEDEFFRRATAAGHEGIMAKDPDAAYTPGRRTESWMKIKPAFETLDVVVVGGIYGSGRRRGLLSSLVVAVRHKDEFLTVGKVGTGFSEGLLRDLTARLEGAVTAARGGTVEVEPQIVVEVDFQDIQKTDRHPAGHVLRIPRFRRERTDKSTREADTLERLRRLYRQMHGKEAVSG